MPSPEPKSPEWKDGRSWLRSMSSLALIVAIAISMSTSPGAGEDERISAFVMGHSQWVWHNPFRILFLRDPLFTHALYPLPEFIDIAAKAKLDRVYWPRSRTLLTEGYQVMVFHDIRTAFTDKQVFDLDYAFREAGVSAMCGLCLGWDYAWQPTILADVLPVSEHGSVAPFFRGYTVKFERDRDPVFLPFLEYGIEKVVGDQYCTMQVKQGATVWGIVKPWEIPWMVSWRPGGADAGMQWLVSHTFEGWWAEEENPYSLDVATNMIFYALKEPLIADIPGRREARKLFTNLQAQKSIVMSMMEWAENFGATVVTLQERLSELEGEMGEGTSQYLERDYTAAIGSLESVSLLARDIATEAVRVKDEALFWVYLSEWLVVTATAIISGTTVWSLMVRRRFYRASRETRLRPIY